MNWEICFRYLHFLSIIVVAGTLVSEHILIKKRLERSLIRRISMIDGIFGIAGLVLIGSGFMLWFGYGRPAEFYTKNGIFHFKLLLVALFGIISIWPTVWYLKNYKGDQNELVEVPKHIFIILRIELLILVSIPMLATLMSKGIGYNG